MDFVHSMVFWAFPALSCCQSSILCPATMVKQLVLRVTVKYSSHVGGIGWKSFLSFSLWFHLVCSTQHKTESIVPFCDLAQPEGQRKLETKLRIANGR